mmetsp:Transcript_24158/g.60735  ORF Transcript_24158/g.60735 Transcript_24158/m.60735 type:complete len:619 (-) Transcript_24158:430-2286(-)
MWKDLREGHVAYVKKCLKDGTKTSEAVAGKFLKEVMRQSQREDNYITFVRSCVTDGVKLSEEDMFDVLKEALRKGEINLLDACVKKGANIVTRKIKQRVLDESMKNGQVQFLEVCLKDRVTEEKMVPFLREALRKGHSLFVKKCLKNGVRISEAKTAEFLGDALCQGSCSFVKECLKYGVQISEASMGHLLEKAMCEGHTGFVMERLETGVKIPEANLKRLLIKAGTDDLRNRRNAFVNLMMQNLSTIPADILLDFEIIILPDVVDRLLQVGASPCVQCIETGQTPLMIGATSGCEDTVRHLLQKTKHMDPYRYHEHWSKKDEDHCTALMMAAEKGHHSIVQMLLETDSGSDRQGADRNMKDKNKETALMKCVSGGHIDVARTLLEFGAKTELTALERLVDDHEVMQPNMQMTELLVKHLSPSGQREVMHRYARQGKAVELKLLVDAGARTEERDKDRQTALMLGAQHGHERVVRVLCQAGSKCGGRGEGDKFGRTPFMKAARNGHVNVLKAMFKESEESAFSTLLCDTDVDGKTALDFASELEVAETAEYLRELCASKGIPPPQKTFCPEEATGHERREEATRHKRSFEVVGVSGIRVQSVNIRMHNVSYCGWHCGA